MFKAFLNTRGRKPRAEDSAEQQAQAMLNARMQRMLALHLQANAQPQPLPKTEKAA